MPMPSRLYMIVPVLNESGNLERLFESFRSVATDYAGDCHVQFVMVDDGSSDGTGQRATELAGDLDFVLLTHATNQGPGRAFGTAFAYLAPRLDAQDQVVTLEGDNTSRQELLRQMFRRASEGYDVVLASPYLYGGGIANTSPLRVFLSHMANAFVKEFLEIHGIMTVSSFFRLYQGSMVRRLQAHYGPQILERRGFECMVELLLKLIYLEATISEVPMRLDTSLRVGKSRMNVTRTIQGYLALWSHTKRWKRLALAAESEEHSAATTGQSTIPAHR